MSMPKQSHELIHHQRLIAPVTLNTINNNASGATFGSTCENIIFLWEPPVILAESTNGLTFT